MLVVSDTSPLSNLAIIGRLSLLQEQFSEAGFFIDRPLELRVLAMVGESAP